MVCDNHASSESPDFISELWGNRVVIPYSSLARKSLDARNAHDTMVFFLRTTLEWSVFKESGIFP